MMSPEESAQQQLDEVIMEWLPPPPEPVYNPSVNFQMGIHYGRHETAREKHDRIRASKLKKMEEQRKKRRRAARLAQKGPAEPFHPWRILPNAQCPSAASAFCVDLLSGNTYLQKKKSLEALALPVYCPKGKMPSPPSVKQTRRNLIIIKKQAAELMEMNQKIRWILRRFLHNWRLKHLRLHNTEDPITMSQPEKPVFIYSLPQRRTYQFDAASLARTFHLRLLHHDGPFPKPLKPMNPFTNELMSLSQCVSLFLQLRRQGISYWTLDAFRSSNFCVSRFGKAHDKALRLHALKAILWDYKDYDGIDTVYDFIEAQHDYHGQDISKQLYTWYLQRFPDECIMMQWRRLCQKWHENEILEGEGPVKEIIFDQIYNATEKLCDMKSQLLVKRRIFLAQCK